VNGWIVPIVLYALGFGLFGILGGLSSAAEAFRQWGNASSTARSDLASSST
jgi:hypothetical protein